MLNRSKFYHKHLSYTILIACISIIILIIIQTYNRALRPIGNDFTCYLISSEDFFNDKNPYTTNSAFRFIYPQFFDIIMYPFTIVHYNIAVFLWILLNYLSLFFSTKFILEIIIDKKISYKKAFFAFSIVNILLFSLVQDNFLNGQVNILLLYLCILFLKYYLKNNQWASSLFLATAISIKITPAIFFIFLLYNKRFYSIFLTSFLSLFFIFGLPYIIIGFKSIEYYQYYLNTFILKETTKQADGFSLTNMISHLFPKFSIFISSAVLLSICLFYHLKHYTKNSEIFNLKVFSLFLLNILLISPMSEGHHLIFTLPTYLLIVNQTITSSITSKQNIILILFVIIITICILFLKKISFIIFLTLVAEYIILLNLDRIKNNQ